MQTYIPESPAFGEMHSSIALHCASGHIEKLVEGCRDYVNNLPRWRWLRRYHIERELAIIELALVAYTYGIRRGGKR